MGTTECVFEIFRYLKTQISQQWLSEMRQVRTWKKPCSTTFNSHFITFSWISALDSAFQIQLSRSELAFAPMVIVLLKIIEKSRFLHIEHFQYLIEGKIYHFEPVWDPARSQKIDLGLFSGSAKSGIMLSFSANS